MIFEEGNDLIVRKFARASDPECNRATSERRRVCVRYSGGRRRSRGKKSIAIERRACARIEINKTLEDGQGGCRVTARAISELRSTIRAVFISAISHPPSTRYRTTSLGRLTRTLVASYCRAERVSLPRNCDSGWQRTCYNRPIDRPGNCLRHPSWRAEFVIRSLVEERKMRRGNSFHDQGRG